MIPTGVSKAVAQEHWQYEVCAATHLWGLIITKKQNGREDRRQFLQEDGRMEVPQTVSLCWGRLAKKGTLGSKTEPALPTAAYVQRQY